MITRRRAPRLLVALLPTTALVLAACGSAPTLPAAATPATDGAPATGAGSAASPAAEISTPPGAAPPSATPGLAGPSVTTGAVGGAAADWRTDPNEPYPFRTPVPPLAPTALDGIYTRQPTDPYTGTRAPCRRCPPYPLDRGASALTLREGRFLMEHREPQYRMIGHFVVAGDEIVLFNDAECSATPGRYRWRLEGDTLTFEVVEDPCGFGQRAKDFTARAWSRLGEASAATRCDPPNEEAAISGHWPAPSGC